MISLWRDWPNRKQL